ncbi:MAG: 50S ribosomal protein L9 [Prevotella sp.]|nr:50S ribosomal protein L9 [Prevotella sp.]
MELILKEDIIGLGYKNDIVNVKSGYGRNYLIPQQKAVIASPSAKKILAENLKQQAHKIAAQKAAAEDKAKAFEGVSLEIPAKVAVTGQLYGSVGAAQVVEALAAKGIEVDRKIVTMKEAKKVGEYEAVVHFHKEVEVKVPVLVVAENPEALAPAKVEEAPKAVEAVEEAPVAVEEAPVVEEAPAAEEAEDEAAEA